MNGNVYWFFIDYNKAFNKIYPAHLVKLLEEKTLDLRDIIVIANLYYGHGDVVQMIDKSQPRFSSAVYTSTYSFQYVFGKYLDQH